MTDKKNRFAFLKPEPHLGALEDAYRKHALYDDRGQARIMIWIYIFAIVLYALIDYQLFKGTNALLGLYLIRFTLITTSLGVIVFISKNQDYKKLDSIILAWALMIAIFTMLINFTRSKSYFYNAPVDVLILIGIYLAVPNRFFFRVIPAFLYTMFSAGLFIFYRTALDPAGLRSTLIAYFTANLLGYITSVRYYASRREQFLSQSRETSARRAFETLAQTDSLTLTLNRRSFMESTDREIERFRYYQSQPFCLLYMDLDGFKEINDTVGHSAGDIALKQFAAVAQTHIRHGDLIGRIGGDEFCILLNGAELNAAGEVATRILEGCRGIEVKANDRALNLSICIGIAQIYNGDATVDDILYRADQALYRAKREGRNQYQIASEEDALLQ